MSKAQHTPGPWCVGEMRREFIDINHRVNDRGAISKTLAHAIARSSWIAEGEANARLIAAAPELLEALELLRPLIGGSIHAVKIRSLIAEIRGE